MGRREGKSGGWEQFEAQGGLGRVGGGGSSKEPGTVQPTGGNRLWLEWNRGDRAGALRHNTFQKMG